MIFFYVLGLEKRINNLDIINLKKKKNLDEVELKN